MAVTVDVVHVVKRYGRKVGLHDMSFHVAPGSALGLVGPNGAGKSTLLRLLLGLSRPTRGNIWLNGVALWPRPERAMVDVGGFVDLPRFYPYLSAAENLAMLADLTGCPRQRVIEVLQAVHLYEARLNKVGGFSHGMRQRLGIAVALLKRPGLMVLDEPQDGLDPARLEEMRGVIEQARQELGATFIMSSHLMQDVERLCDQIAVFDGGWLRYFGSPADLGKDRGEEVLWEIYPAGPAVAFLRGLGIWARCPSSDRVLALWSPARDLEEVNRILIQQGFRIRTVVIRSASLESRLLRYLGDSHVDVR